MIIAFTGHRPEKLGGYGPSAVQDDVRRRIRNALADLRPSHAISGMALGVDQWAAEECDAAGIPWTAAIPFKGQESQWPAASQRRYRDLLGWATRIHVVSPGGYTREKMQDRNRWMVDNCDLLIAVWDGSDGGTANCYRYAKSIGRRIARINPLRRSPQATGTTEESTISTGFHDHPQVSR